MLHEPLHKVTYNILHNINRLQYSYSQVFHTIFVLYKIISMRQLTVTVQKFNANGEAHSEEMPIKVWESIGEDKNKMGWTQVATAPREVIELKSKNAAKQTEVVEEVPEVIGADEPKAKTVKAKK